MWRKHNSRTQSFIFPAFFREEIRSRLIMWTCYQLTFTDNLEKSFAWRSTSSKWYFWDYWTFFFSILNVFRLNYKVLKANLTCTFVTVQDEPRCFIVWLHFQTWKTTSDHEGSCWDRRSEQPQEMVARLVVLLSVQLFHRLWQAFWQWNSPFCPFPPSLIASGSNLSSESRPYTNTVLSCHLLTALMSSDFDHLIVSDFD